MDDEDFNAVMAGLEDVRRFEAGESKGFIVHAPKSVDVKSIRSATKKTQKRFARTYGFSVALVKDWEQGPN